MSYSSSPGFKVGATSTTSVRNAGKRKALAAASLNSIATVLTPTSGKKYRLLGGDISLSAAASILFEDNAAGTTVYQTPLMAANTPYQFDLGPGYLSPTADNVLKGTASVNASITGTLYYSEE